LHLPVFKQATEELIPEDEQWRESLFGNPVFDTDDEIDRSPILSSTDTSTLNATPI
jgi:hypothetical protein